MYIIKIIKDLINIDLLINKNQTDEAFLKLINLHFLNRFL